MQYKYLEISRSQNSLLSAEKGDGTFPIVTLQALIIRLKAGIRKLAMR